MERVEDELQSRQLSIQEENSSKIQNDALRHIQGRNQKYNQQRNDQRNDQNRKS